MPEGDTIHRAASALRTALSGKAMIRFDAPRLIGPVPQAGRTIEKVESHGKHLEIEWDNGMVLHTHMRMSGSWHVYRQGERWRRPYQQMRASIENHDWVAVCFNAPLVETFRRPDKRRHPGMGRLGPDLCKTDADLSLVVNLLLSFPDADAPIGEVMLDQRVMCGVGNVFRCEVLWATGISPYARAGDITEGDAVRLVNTAASQLRANLTHPKRITTTDVRGGLAVYGRNGQRCGRCPGSIDTARMGTHNRVLYWCPSCQTHLDPRVQQPQADDTPVMDPHPAAQRFLADLPWNRRDAAS
jgi:endonuclease-8